ncbi:MAG: glutamate 5-kinase [Eubacteriales bacterium]|nr:glutamate 5-kinase [Eubacteriales bacterium]
MRIVIKIGTSTITNQYGIINEESIDSLCFVVSKLKEENNEVIMVSSGAIAMGVGKLSLEKKPKDIPTKQACAAIGQLELMGIYDKHFQNFGQFAAQILLTEDDINNDIRRENFKNTILRIIHLGAIPIINENDTVAIKEICSIGDNDTLAAYVAANIDADLLILLSDIDGLYTNDPKQNKDATLIKNIYEITDDIYALCGDKGSELSTGGMITKINAAKITCDAGTDLFITNGKDPKIIFDIINGKEVGTRFIAKK